MTLHSNTFEHVNGEALARGYLLQLFPQGRRVGRELQVGNLQGDPGRSLCVNLSTGAWIDNATSERGGDVVSLVAARERLTQLDAAKLICRELRFDWPGGQSEGSRQRLTTVSRSSKQEIKALDFQPMEPPKGDAGPDFTISGRSPSLVSTYYHADGRLAFHIARYEARTEEDRKLIQPFAYGEFGGKTGWHRKMPPGERPLLGLLEMVNGGPKPGLVVEGEKSYEAARRLLGTKYLIFTWAGGSQAVGKTDWRMLDGLSAVYIWPDADVAGQKAAEQIAETINAYPGAKVYIITPPAGSPAGWDLADAETEGWTL